jgi:single-strand DNA-binding protein
MNGIVAAVQGRLPKDAGELRYTSGGRAFVGFSLAVNDDKRGGNEPTEWVRVTLWGEIAEQLDGSLTKGKEVYAEGRLRLKSWTTAEGIDRPSLEISAWRCDLIGAIGRSAPRRQDAGQRRPRAMPQQMAIGAGAGRNIRQQLGLDDDLSEWPG